jgi:hypothetical protein
MYESKFDRLAGGESLDEIIARRRAGAPVAMPEVPGHVRDMLSGPGAGSLLAFYSPLYVAINGSLQMDAQRVDVRHGPDKSRVYVRWAVPTKGLEFDGADSVGTDRAFAVCVLGPGCEAVIARNMYCRWFALGHTVNQESVARAIFECDRLGT